MLHERRVLGQTGVEQRDMLDKVFHALGHQKPGTGNILAGRGRGQRGVFAEIRELL